MDGCLRMKANFEAFGCTLNIGGSSSVQILSAASSVRAHYGSE